MTTPVLSYCTAAELNTLQKLWNTGKLQPISDHLLDFIRSHREEIHQFTQTGSNSVEALLEAAMSLVRKRGSINLPLDMADQIREINNEIWYQGEKGYYDRSKIKEEWAFKYAHQWRDWRVKEILYVIERRASDVAAALAAS
jgi:hypothetical protein